jgi:hypothetical protein
MKMRHPIVMNRKVFTWAVGIFLIMAALPGISGAESIAVTIIQAGGDPAAAVQQAIAAGEDPVAVAEAAVIAAPGAGVEIAEAALADAPELAYEVAFVVAKSAPADILEDLIAVITAIDPGVDAAIVAAIVSRASTVGDDVLVINVQIDPDTNGQVITVSTMPGDGDTQNHIVVNETYNFIEAPESNEDLGDEKNSWKNSSPALPEESVGTQI